MKNQIKLINNLFLIKVVNLYGSVYAALEYKVDIKCI